MKKQQMEMDKIITDIKKYLILNDEHIDLIYLLIATALSTYTSHPFWIFIIGPPSSGKTELTNILSKCNLVHEIHTLTKRTLFSGHPEAKGGYMHRNVKQKGVIIFPDFTTVLSLNSKDRKEILNQLRVIFDGKASLGTGIDTGKIKKWKGKVSVIALSTQSAEKLKSSSNDLGERFCYFNFEPKEISFNELKHFEPRNEIKDQIPKNVKMFINDTVSDLEGITLTREENEFLFNLSRFIAVGRASVERNGYSRDIENVHSPEGTYRIRNQLISIYRCLKILDEDQTLAERIIKNIAISSIPKSRYKIIDALYRSSNKSIGVDDLQTKLKFDYSNSVIKRITEDMLIQKIIYNKNTSENKNLYAFTLEFGKLLKSSNLFSFPKKGLQL